jgi:hypothetical protein
MIDNTNTSIQNIPTPISPIIIVPEPNIDEPTTTIPTSPKKKSYADITSSTPSIIHNDTSTSNTRPKREATNRSYKDGPVKYRHLLSDYLLQVHTVETVYRMSLQKALK